MGKLRLEGAVGIICSAPTAKSKLNLSCIQF